MGEWKRTHTCGELRRQDVGAEVVLTGWVRKHRDLGGCTFVDLRDRFGITQLKFDPAVSPAIHEAAAPLRSEWVIGVRGAVVDRGKNENKKLPTGAVEVEVTELKVFSEAKTPPFTITDEVDASEELRLKYRYLDLRRRPLLEKLVLRHQAAQITRRYLSERGFLELETPMLARSTPEGARDYLVPSRVHAGRFYALPQSPQQFKQIFMVAGYDRYFQLVRCFRDEDLRADRQPEFTQIDAELSFVDPEDIYEIMSGLVRTLWQEGIGAELPADIPRMTYADAMERYGIDRPDLRFALELCDVGEAVRECSFRVVTGALEAGGLVKALRVPGGASFSRKQIDGLTDVCKRYGAKGMVAIKIAEGGKWASGPAKFFDDVTRAKVNERVGLEAGDLLCIVADSFTVTNAALAHLRLEVAAKLDLIDSDAWCPVWITEFPLFEEQTEDGRYFSKHHPFTSPHPEDLDRLESDPASVRSLGYDLVLNGVELGGGSIRIHDQHIQRQVFRLLGMDDAEAEERFGFLLEALTYGTPPHGGIAFGFDRIIMLLAGADSLRDVIAFPKTTSASDLMMEAPSPVDPEQLDELHVKVK